jgi:hypothetical protein
VTRRILGSALMALVMAPMAATTARAQAPAPAEAAPPPAAAAPADQEEDDPDRDINLAQPDFTVVTLPTTLRVPRHKSAFRVTHRFGRPLGNGDFGDLVGDLFGFDNGGPIGLEYRFGLFRGAQVGIHRTSNKTIQFFGQYDIKDQGDDFPIGIAVHASAEGTNNFRDSYSPGLGLVLSREFGSRGALYLEPFWVNNTNPEPKELVDDNNTVIIGLGTRVRIRPSVYLVLEAAPRITGFNPGVDHVSFGIEKRAGGHAFQLNFSNGFGTTLADVARGGFNSDDWYIGFNLSRKFF